MKLTSRDIHNELAEFYRPFRGTPAPVNSWTEAVWIEIERLEREEGVLK